MAYDAVKAYDEDNAVRYWDSILTLVDPLLNTNSSVALDADTLVNSEILLLLAILFFYSNTINPNGLITYYDLLYGYMW